MTTFRKGTIEKTEENRNWYDRKGYHMTGETLAETITDRQGYETTTEYVIFEGTWTRSGTVRDCGDHYIIARYSRYDSIDKDTLEIKEDVEDR